ncbi:trichohyalin isoform X2 [Danio aesculapii]|uniref:trichohyalin isoform X2 n=1 Tax=Danio aesculapii TaxID=1142201 RepID=UPI0024BFBD32|nr:trichohyalin isoform X2 [Danio aesculapii]
MKRQTSGEADQHEQHNNMEISNVSLEMNREDDQLKTEEREDQHDQQREQSHCSQFCSQEKSEQREREPPDMSSTSPLRILLLGKSVSENSRVGNLILGRSAFDSEAPSDVVERVGGRLKHRQVTLINSPQLLHTNISDDQITQTVRECVSLSDPGPHVVLLLLQHQQCSAEDQERVEKLQDSFSERLLQHTLVLSTQEPTEPNQILQKIIQTCSNRHFSLQRSSSADHLLQAFEDIEQSNEGRHLISGDSQCSTVEKRDTQTHSEKLNVLVCGSDGSLKSSISELILQHTHRRSESVRTDVDLHGRLINVLELPALFNTGLSEEEVMRQTLRCVSLCHPGVHAFLFIISDAPLNNEGRAEMEEIQKIFSSRINKHIMILIMQNPEHQTAELNEETQAVIQSFGGRHHYFNPRTQESTLMENIEKMLDENRGGVYSTETFLEVQMEKLVKYEEMKKKMNSLETHVLSQGSRVNTDDELRIVLLGKSGVGKSETGNTILGRKSFTAETSHQPVTKETQRETCEINGRQVTVVDTPGVFDTELTEEEIQREIRHCISMILPGPHVFLLLVPLGRFTKEEETSVKIIQETLGENSLMFTMVLFTRGDSLGNKSISQCLGKPGSPLMNLIEACGHRYHVFNNNQPEERTQVSDLLEKIDNMVKANGGSFYSCKMFREMEREKQEQQMKILMDRVRETEEEVKKLEEEKERMKIMMEEEQQNQEKERKRREEELKREIRDGEKHQREMKEMKRERETFRHEMEEIGREKEKLQIQYETETDRLMKRIETERKKREKEFTEKEEKYKTLIKEKEREMKEEMKREREEMRKEKEKLQVKNETETDRLMNRVEDERQNHEKERKKREEEFNEREEQHKREMKEKEEKMKREREEWEKQRQEEKIRRDEEDDKRREKEQRDRDEFNEKLKEEKDRMKREKEDLQSKHEEKENSMKIQIEQMNGEREELMKRHEEEKERMKMMQGERQNQEKDRKRREEELMKKHEEEKEKMKMMMEEEQDNQKKDRKRREEELMRKQEEEKERMKMMMEEERQNQETEINRREEDFREREERYKRLIKEREQKEKELLEQMKLERTHKPEERLRREEEEKEEEKQESEHKRHQSPVSDQTTEIRKPNSSMMYQTLQKRRDDDDQDCLNHEHQLLLIGKSGCGKSITGNMIFNASVFESRKSSSSVTRVSQTHTGSVNNRRLTVVDTPDFRFSTHTDFDSNSELKRALQLCAPGAHVILLFLPLSTFTEQEQEFIHWFEQKFGAEALRFTLVLFTHADKPHMRTLGELIRGNTQLSDFINRYGHRYHEFNIKAPANSRQVTELMEKVERLVSENSHYSYTLEMMEEEEKRRKEKEMKEEEEKRREHQITLERVRQETEIQVRREYEEEKQRREEEIRKREEQMALERDRQETDIRVRGECEEKQSRENRDSQHQRATELKQEHGPKNECILN